MRQRFFVKAGTNNDGIHNGEPNAAVPSDPGLTVPLPARGSNVTLRNFMLNGNQGDGLHGDSTTGQSQGPTAADLWYFGINLMNLDNITLENRVVVNTPAYHVRLSTVGHVTVSGCVMNSSGPNTDGLHFDGPANDVKISYCDFTMGDDAIALNCPEGYSGDIARVEVTNCTFNSLSLMRLYTANSLGFERRISAVTVSNCTGSMFIAGFLVGMIGNSLPNAQLELSVSNCQLTAPAVLDITADFSTIEMSHVTLISHPDHGSAFARTYFNNSRLAYTGASLTFDNCVIQRMGDYPVPGLIVESGSTIKEFAISGFAVQDPVGTSYNASPEFLQIVSGSVGQLVIDGLTSTHMANPVSSGGFSSIGAVSGAGVLATGWAFPDAVMGNQSPYLSATTGQPSIKIGGVVKPYP